MSVHPKKLDSVFRKIKNRKAAGLDDIPPEEWKTRQFDDIPLRQCNAVYNQNTIDRLMKGCILPFPKKGYLGLAKNNRGITLTSIAAKIYNALLRNRIEPKIDNILRKYQNGFRRNGSTTSQILTIRRILDGTPLKLVDKFTYLGSSVSSIEKDIDTRLTKAWTVIDWLSIIWKSDMTDKMKHSFFPAAVVSILLYGCTTWTLTKRLKKKLNSNYTNDKEVWASVSPCSTPATMSKYSVSPYGDRTRDQIFTIVRITAQGQILTTQRLVMALR